MLYSVKFPQHRLQKVHYVVPDLRDLGTLILHLLPYDCTSSCVSQGEDSA